MSPTQQNRWFGYAFSLAGATLFSTKAIFIKLAFREEVNATLMLAWRMIFSIPFFVAVGIWAWRQRRSKGEALPDARMFIAAVATGCIGYYFSSYADFKGLEYISAQLERLVLFTYPLFVMFIGAAWWKQPLTRYGLVAAGITYAGLALVFGLDVQIGGRETIIGSAFVLACAIAFAIYQLLAKPFITLMGSALFTSIALTSSGIACVLHQAFWSGGNFSASSQFLWYAGGCSIFATVIPSFLMNAGMARISSQAVAMISTISPLVTIILAIFILGEDFTFADAIGSTLVLVGVGYYTFSDMRQKSATMPQQVSIPKAIME